MINDPSISVNKLAEYITSKGARQRKILADRKYPDPNFNIGMYHREADEAVREYIVNGAIDPKPLSLRIQTLSQQPTEKVGTARRINANIDALERFSEMLDDLDLMGATPEHGSQNSGHMMFHNVKISVRPEIIVRGKGPKGQTLVGAWKLHFSKTHPHDDESAGYVSAIVQEYVKNEIAGDDEIVHPNYCKVIDVASGVVFPGVKATNQRMKDIAAECQNISGLWASI